MRALNILLVLSSITLFTACNKSKVAELEKEVTLKNDKIKTLEDQVDYLKNTNNSLLDRMSDLSIVSKTGAESIKKSVESMTQQYDQIQDLNARIRSKDSLNLALVMNLKRSLSDVNDDDIQVEVRGGKVHVSISDKLLFRSGSASLSNQSKGVLEKIASVVNDHNDLDVMVEGHTDNIPMSNGCITDNWDLSVKRATSVVRALHEQHYVDPERMIAAGRSEFMPREDNDTEVGRSTNRRTEIVIMPQLDQFFKLMESPTLPD